jgi:toxin YhaV
MSQLNARGWTIVFYTDFRLQWEDLTGKAIKLKSRLKPEDFVCHPDVKLLKAIPLGAGFANDSGIRDKIALDPFASHFALRKPLQIYGRLKKMGLPQRYRLFFRAFADQKVIIMLWLGFPRKEGDRKDCYQVFARMLANGKLPESYESLLAECDLNETSTIEVELAAEDLMLDETLLPDYLLDRVASTLRNRE